MSSSSRWAYSVIRKYHWVSSRLVTTAPQRSHTPPHDLLVGQHGLVVRAPVDVAAPPVGQPALAEAQEQPLRPPVVVRVGRVQPAGPVEAHARSGAATRPASRCWRRCRSPGARCAGSRRSRPAARTSPSRSGSARRSRAAASSGPARRAAPTPRRGPCAGRPTGRGTSSARSAAPWSRRPARGNGSSFSQTGRHLSCAARTSYARTLARVRGVGLLLAGHAVLLSAAPGMKKAPQVMRGSRVDVE